MHQKEVSRSRDTLHVAVVSLLVNEFAGINNQSLGLPDLYFVYNVWPVEHRKAIRNNVNSIEAMEKAIMATWNHIRSTDENLQHHLCPTGEHSW